MTLHPQHPCLPKNIHVFKQPTSRLDGLNRPKGATERHYRTPLFSFLYLIGMISYDGIKDRVTPVTSTGELSELTKKSAADTVAIVRGDWVLFHPVYTPEEMKAVKLCWPLDTYHGSARSA
jgi:hypothetical protein